MAKFDHKARYQKLKAMNLCTRCARNPARPGRTYCEECAAGITTSRHMAKLQTTSALCTEEHKPAYTLEEVNRMAVQRGISYGQMVTILEQEEKNGKKSQ